MKQTISTSMASLHTHVVQYYETDQMKVVHHSNYIRWMEEARSKFLDEIGWNYAKLEEIGIISPVIEIECKYKHSVRFGETVRVETKVEHYNGIKLFISYRIINVETNVLCAFGTSVHCFIDPEGRPMILKKSNPEFDSCLRAFVLENVN